MTLLISEHIMEHFQKVYTTEHSFSYDDPKLYNIPHPTTHCDDYNMLCGQPCLLEIKSVLFSFQPLKAPSPNGLHPMFFQTLWNETNHHLS